jgi:hypothetical protein
LLSGQKTRDDPAQSIELFFGGSFAAHFERGFDPIVLGGKTDVDEGIAFPKKL